MVASSAAKPRRLSMVRTPSPSRPLRREGARSCAHHQFVQERLLPGGRLNNRRAWATRWGRPRDRSHPRGGCGRALAYLPLPSAIGGKSASLLTVFLPTCSPPLSRNIARATAITAPRMAPSVPFRALLSLIINSDPDLGQRPCRIEVPEGDERARNCGSLV